MKRIAVALVCAASAVGCAHPAPPREASQEDWTVARGLLAGLRASEIGHPYVEQVRLAMHEPRTQRVIEGRGVVAVDPRRAARMILLGPGGTTLMDLWITPERFRMIVPPLSYKRTGGAGSAEALGLPVGFFRWWLLAPFEGRLLTTVRTDHGPALVLGRSESVVRLRVERLSGGYRLVGARRAGADVEGLAWQGRALTPHPGDYAVYVQKTTGLTVEVLVEDVSDDAPDPAAFADPDARGLAL